MDKHAGHNLKLPTLKVESLEGLNLLYPPTTLQYRNALNRPSCIREHKLMLRKVMLSPCT
jgi:hypothetical protein